MCSITYLSTFIVSFVDPFFVTICIAQVTKSVLRKQQKLRFENSCSFQT